MDADKRLFLILVVAVPLILLLLYIAGFGQKSGYEEYLREPLHPDGRGNDAVREYI